MKTATADTTATVSELTKHIENQSVRERTRAFLLETLAELDAIDELSDVYNDALASEKDGVPLTTVNELDRQQEIKIARLSQISFEDDEIDVPVVDEVREIDVRQRYGRTALMQAVIDHDILTVKNCLRLGADKFIPDNGGNTPYQKAMRLGYLDVAELLR